MCGISGGIVMKSPSSQRTIFDFTERAISMMHHRGPDSSTIKTFDSGNLCLGHNRLKIVDLSDGAQQPMESDLSIIIFNGEIYNHGKIREHLVKLGLIFQTNSDTEVLQKFLDFYGTSELNMLNGMFSLAYFNKLDQSLTLIRDRFGVKPLYYQTKLGCLFFGSEMRIFLNSKKHDVNMDLINSFIQETATDFGSQTVYKGIEQVKPGHLVRVCSGAVSEHKWYSPRPQKKSLSISEFNKRFEDTLWDSIKLRLACDVPVCITLSGGLDSSTIYTLIKERSNQKITVFTFDHPGRKSSELARVKSLTSKYGDELVVVSDPEIAKTSMKDILSDLEILEFPIWSFSSRAYRQMYQEIASRGFRVVIEGHGGDEILGGYQYMVEALLSESIRKFRLPTVLTTLKTIAGLQGEKNILNKKIFSNLYLQMRLLIPGIPNRVPTFYGERLNAVNFKILPIVLRAFDRLSMNYSLESRCPFLDFRVVELSFSAKDKFLINASGTKLPLRSILKKYRNFEVANHREKIGFASDLETMHQSTLLRSNLQAEVDVAKKLFPQFNKIFNESYQTLDSDLYDDSRSFNASKYALLAVFLSRNSNL
jgi:asparagine synthase (glutamine-hydrolysing)